MKGKLLNVIIILIAVLQIIVFVRLAKLDNEIRVFNSVIQKEHKNTFEEKASNILRPDELRKMREDGS